MKPLHATRVGRFAGRIVLMLCLAAISLPALAQIQARLDRNPIDLGESVTLTLENARSPGAPDLTDLRADFDVLGQSSRQSLQLGAGRSTRSSVIELTLAPKRAGVLQIPSLQIGGERSPALSLNVRPAPPVNSANGDADIFLETEVDASAPYVQQSVGVVLRLSFAMPLLSGELLLDPPANAVMQKVGSDVETSRQINGRSFTVLERRFLLVPERSGPLTLPAPRFRGRAAVGWFDNLMGNRREVSASGQPRLLQVRAQPANAAQPWLPLRDLRLRYVGAPNQARAGQAAIVTIEGVADGATRAQLPELAAPAVAGAQVLPEPMQYDETFVDGRPQVKWTQRYAVVPERAGELVIGGTSMAWWDVAAGTGKVERLGDLRLQVTPALAASAAPAALPSSGSALEPSAAPGLLGGIAELPRSPWVWLTVGFAVLWLLTLLWALHRRAAPVAVSLDARGPGPAMPQATATLADLKRALDTGSLDDVAEAVRQMHVPPLQDLDAVIARLARADQRQALQALRRARWADGDGVAARQQLRAAFAQGPQWLPGPTSEQAPLPPLYPSA